jgi:hypothetical protein
MLASVDKASMLMPSTISLSEMEISRGSGRANSCEIVELKDEGASA